MLKYKLYNYNNPPSPDNIILTQLSNEVCEIADIGLFTRQVLLFFFSEPPRRSLRILKIFPLNYTKLQKKKIHPVGPNFGFLPSLWSLCRKNLNEFTICYKKKDPHFPENIFRKQFLIMCTRLLTLILFIKPLMLFFRASQGSHKKLSPQVLF